MTMRTFSYGGGVQSTAALVLAAQGRIDYKTFLFSNVGDDSEDPRTLKYVKNHAAPFADRHGIDLHLLERVKRTGESTTLWKELMREESRSIQIPARMDHNGAPGTRNCTFDFKMRVILRWQREHGATKHDPAVCGIGISIDEAHRARTDSGFPAQLLEYPLMDLHINRDECKRIIEAAGLPVPPKSACFFCPFHDTAAWRRLATERPKLFEKAAVLEDKLIERTKKLGRTPVYLTRHCRPLREVGEGLASQLDFDYDGPETCDSGHCWT